METYEVVLLKSLANELGWKEVSATDEYIEISGGFKRPERFDSLEECKNFLINEKRIHETRLKENRESYIRIRQRRNSKS